MFYNFKKEHIYFMATKNENSPLNIFLAGVSEPNPEYIVAHTKTTGDDFDRYQFEFIVSGKGYLKVNDEVYELSPGDFLFVNKFVKNILYSDKEDPMQKLFITVNGSLIDNLLIAYDINNKFFIKKLDLEARFKAMLNALKMSREDNDSNNVYRLISIELHKFILTMAEYIKIDKHVKNRCTASDIASYIDDNIYHDFSLDDVSKNFVISKNQLIRIFKQKYDTTPIQYAIKKKIAISVYYLIKTNTSIQSISDMLGFTDSKHFSNTFRKIVGQTPRDYRKENMESVKPNFSDVVNEVIK